MKVLVTRTDRLGDLVLSLPALDLLRAARPDWEVHAMVAPAALPLVEHAPGLAGVWTWSRDAVDCDRRALAADLRRTGFDVAVMLQYRRELALMLRRAGVRRLWGPRSKPTSWFLLHGGLRQARSRRDRHESDQNADLVRALLGEPDRPAGRPRLALSDGQRAAGAAFRRERAPGAEVLAFVHPGSGGSALDWSPAAFAVVANALAARPGWRVCVTGAADDAAPIAAMAPALAPTVEVLLDAFDLRGLLGVLGAGDVFVGPSTGPLHMAAALDLAAVGLYPPVRTMAPERWGPRGRWTRTLVPGVDCPARRTCRGPRCPLHNCLDGIAADAVVAAAVDLESRRRAAATVPEGAPEESM